jgi:hypothetical protein
MGGAALVFTEAPDWHFPAALVAPLAYWVLVCSVAGYLIVTWAMRHLPASQVAAFQCLQPFLGSALAFAVLHERLSWWDLGAVGVVAGLALVSTDMREAGGGGAGGGGGAAVAARLRRLVAAKSAVGLAALGRAVNGAPP